MLVRSLAVVLLLPAIALAQESDLRLPISLDADSTDYDGKSSMLMFRGLRLSQGTTNIEADIGRASKLDFKDSVWVFNGNVVIDVDAGHIALAASARDDGESILREMTRIVPLMGRTRIEVVDVEYTN